MITTDAKCHKEIKRRIELEVERGKWKELLRGKLGRNQKKLVIKTNAMECQAVWVIDTFMGYEKRRYKKTGGLRNVNMENVQIQMD